MDTSNAISGHKDFLLRIVEQFRQLAHENGEPFYADTWAKPGEAILSISRDGSEGEALRITARFVDDGDGMEEKLALLWECKGEVTRILGLGWAHTTPDASAGLDSTADHIDSESVYAIGKVLRSLRAEIARELRSHSQNAPPAPVFRRQVETFPAIIQESTPQPAGPAARVRQPNIQLLQSALGELTTQLGLKAETAFATFIEATRSTARLKEGDIAAYAQGAIVEVALCYDAFLSRRIRAADLDMEPLRHAVATRKAILFERDEPIRYQFARELVAAMRLYYAEALASRGVSTAAAKDILKSTFGRDATIASNAIAILAQPEPAQRTGLARLLGRNARE